MLHYSSYDISFDYSVEPWRALETLPIGKVKQIANRLGFRTMEGFYECFDETGFHGSIPEEPSEWAYDIRFRKKDAMKLIIHANGGVSPYRLAKRYNFSISNGYAGRRSMAEPRLGTMVSKMPSTIGVPRLLTLIEDKADRIPIPAERRSSEYPYEGLPAEIMIFTRLMLSLTGRDKGLSRSYFDYPRLTGDCINPYISTLERIASMWNMSLRSFILGIEGNSLSLGYHKEEEGSDNSKPSVLRRIRETAGYHSWHSFASSFPEERQIGIRHLRNDDNDNIQIYTVLSLMKPFNIRLSDVII